METTELVPFLVREFIDDSTGIARVVPSDVEEVMDVMTPTRFEDPLAVRRVWFIAC
jgi:hypothetical protein